MSSDIGRAAAALIAVILIISVPIAAGVYNSRQTSEYAVNDALKEFTAEVAAKHEITTEAYERLLTGLAVTGVRGQLELTVGKQALRFEEEIRNDIFEVGMPCAAHVHTSNCYKGHNHTSCGCIYHKHTSSCFCDGHMCDCYKTDTSYWTCYYCNGTGTVGSTETCSVCGGEGGYTLIANCHICRGSGVSGISATCPKCGGSGYSSSGKACSRCGSTGYIDTQGTCPLCKGTGTVITDITCASCNGTGKISDVTNCYYCGGWGGGSSTTSYYRCDKCGQGSTTSYGGTCGRRFCEYLFDGFQCGIVENDTTPLCGRIAVDGEYMQNQRIYAGDPVDILDTEIEFTYLDGSRGMVNGVLTDEKSRDTSTPGNFIVDMWYEGYFLNAQNYEKRRFPINVTILPRTAVCERCGKEYYLNPDGTDPGCPYCYDGILGITAICLHSNLSQNDTFTATVYAEYADHTEQIPFSECWCSFVPDIIGAQTVVIGYREFITEVEVYVFGTDNTVIPTDEPTQEDGDEGDNGETDNPDDSGHESDEHETGHDEPTTGIPFPTPENDKSSDICEDRFPSMSRYESILNYEEILELLDRDGRIELKNGDAVSVRFTAFGSGILRIFDIFGSDTKAFTSGTVIF